MTVIEKKIPIEYVRFSANPYLMPAWIRYPGFVIIGKQYESPWDELDIPEGGPIWDTLGETIISRGEILSPLYDPINLIGQLTKQTDGGGLITWHGLPPVDNDMGVSHRTFATSTIVSIAKSLFTGDIDGIRNTILVPDTVGEHSVYHTNHSGHVEAWLGDDFMRPVLSGKNDEDPSYQDARLNVAFFRDASGNLLYRVGSVLMNFPSGSSGPRNPRHFPHYSTTYNDWEWRESVEAGADFLEGEGSSCHDISVFADDDMVTRFSYIHEYWFTTSFAHYLIVHYIEVDLSWIVNPDLSYVLDTALEVGEVVKLHTDYSATLVQAVRKEIAHPEYGWYTIPNYYHNGVVWEFDTPAYPLIDPEYSLRSYDHLLRLSIDKDGKISETDTSYNLLRQFDRRVRSEMPRLVPAVFYSAEEAIETKLKVLEANHLENLTQLGAIADLIEPVNGFRNLASAVISKDPVKIVLSTFDVLSSAQLLWSYGIAPTLNDAKEISERASEVSAFYSTYAMFNMTTFYGKFTFDIPNEVIPPYDDLTLVARSKIRGRVNPNSILASLFPVRAFGLLPTLANMWDLIPFSFVADWFFAIGDKLEAVDANITMLAFDVHYCTSSVKVYWNVADSLKEQSYIRDLKFEGKSLNFSSYVRFVMGSLPSLTYTDLDFRPAHGIPDWKVAASLIFKGFRR